ncbi:hypothetical protein B0H15DRAFT_797758 [Mycena belliarum]|uniref:Uncharacterized protein n=1 Tax=Mycena belliarum TaxID=1033014 RepID=A0AAD6XTF5_9AGAR|nr:hypothetical protein B0H15DRAFT_797758 [Mycena belliae]
MLAKKTESAGLSLAQLFAQLSLVFVTKSTQVHPLRPQCRHNAQDTPNWLLSCVRPRRSAASCRDSTRRLIITGDFYSRPIRGTELNSSGSNREERNAKTRLRMSALRAREATLPQADQEARLEARRASARKYREKNAWRLARKAREARAQARELREAERQEALQARHAELRKARRRRRREKAEAIGGPCRWGVLMAVSATGTLIQCTQNRPSQSFQTMPGPELRRETYPSSGINLQSGERFERVDSRFEELLSLQMACKPCQLRRIREYQGGLKEASPHRREEGSPHLPGLAIPCTACPRPILAESIERAWAENNPVAPATRKMLPGERHQTLHDGNNGGPRAGLTQLASGNLSPMLAVDVPLSRRPLFMGIDGCVRLKSYRGGVLSQASDAAAVEDCKAMTYIPDFEDVSDSEDEALPDLVCNHSQDYCRKLATKTRCCCAKLHTTSHSSGATAALLGLSALSDSLMASSSPHRCEPPWHPDVAGDSPLRADKLYLATGPHLGSIVNVSSSEGWFLDLRTSAQRVVSGSSGATAPLFTSWDALVAAWDAGCGKGGHAHGQDGAVAPPNSPGGEGASSATISMGGRTFHNVPFVSSSRQPRSIASAHRQSSWVPPPPSRSFASPAASPVPPPPSRSFAAPAASPVLHAVAAGDPVDEKAPRKRHAPSTPTKSSPPVPASPSSPRAYSVRWDGEGVVCGSQHEATTLYANLQALGLSPSMMTTSSLGNAADFAEGSRIALLGMQRLTVVGGEGSDSDASE